MIFMNVDLCLNVPDYLVHTRMKLTMSLLINPGIRDLISDEVAMSYLWSGNGKRQIFLTFKAHIEV
jgi:hypothetical protein